MDLKIAGVETSGLTQGSLSAILDAPLKSRVASALYILRPNVCFD